MVKVCTSSGMNFTCKEEDDWLTIGGKPEKYQIQVEKGEILTYLLFFLVNENFFLILVMGTLDQPHC